MFRSWSAASTRYLNSTALCPRCDEPLGSVTVCSSCGVDISGEDTAALWAVSRAAADAIAYR